MPVSLTYSGRSKRQVRQSHARGPQSPLRVLLIHLVHSFLHGFSPIMCVPSTSVAGKYTGTIRPTCHAARDPRSYYHARPELRQCSGARHVLQLAVATMFRLHHVLGPQSIHHPQWDARCHASLLQRCHATGSRSKEAPPTSASHAMTPSATSSSISQSGRPRSVPNTYELSSPSRGADLRIADGVRDSLTALRSVVTRT